MCHVSVPISPTNIISAIRSSSSSSSEVIVRECSRVRDRLGWVVRATSEICTYYRTGERVVVVVVVSGGGCGRTECTSRAVPCRA